jgi:putative transposase
MLYPLNNGRPHEALGMKISSDVHTRSIREYPWIIRDWDYEKEIRAKMVTVNEAIRWKYDLIMVSSALTGKYIGLEEIDTGIFRVYYRQVVFGIFNENTKRFMRLKTSTYKGLSLLSTPGCFFL